LHQLQPRQLRPLDRRVHRARRVDEDERVGRTLDRCPGTDDLAERRRVGGLAGFGALNQAVATGDTRGLAELSDEGCAACQEALRVIAKSHEGGGTVRGGVYSIREVAVDTFFTAERPSLHVVFDRTPRSSVRADGEATEVLPGAAFLTSHVILAQSGDGWRMVEVLATNRII
jgi:hypothetical protein